MYRNASYTPEYATWPYRKELEQRLQNAVENVSAFRKQAPAPGEARIMTQTKFACVGCHQR